MRSTRIPTTVGVRSRFRSPARVRFGWDYSPRPLRQRAVSVVAAIVGRRRDSCIAAVVEEQGLAQTGVMNERTRAQLRLIEAVTGVLGQADISAWLFGGWGLDARIGRITREHGDMVTSRSVV